MNQNDKVNKALADLQTDSVPQVPTEPCTVQWPADMRNRLEKFARLTKHTRSKPHSTEVVGNMSWSSNVANEFFFKHLDLYLQENADMYKRALQPD